MAYTPKTEVTSPQPLSRLQERHQALQSCFTLSLKEGNFPHTPTSFRAGSFSSCLTCFLHATVESLCITFPGDVEVIQPCSAPPQPSILGRYSEEAPLTVTGPGPHCQDICLLQGQLIWLQCLICPYTLNLGAV